MFPSSTCSLWISTIFAGRRATTQRCRGIPVPFQSPDLLTSVGEDQMLLVLVHGDDITQASARRSKVAMQASARTRDLPSMPVVPIWTSVGVLAPVGST